MNITNFPQSLNALSPSSTWPDLFVNNDVCVLICGLGSGSGEGFSSLGLCWNPLEGFKPLNPLNPTSIIGRRVYESCFQNLPKLAQVWPIWADKGLVSQEKGVQIQVFRTFPSLQAAREYRHEEGTGGWIFAPEAGDCVLFPPHLTPTQICLHSLTRGQSGKLIGAN